MKNLKWKKAGSAVLATALAGSMVLPATAYAQGEIVQLEGELRRRQTQRRSRCSLTNTAERSERRTSTITGSSI
ncbi:hypothetical protein M5E84_10095 [[Ruminococcus] torques]|nr:hypothetical protein M5E84_10095 [[Ruminococcus] torques]